MHGAAAGDKDIIADADGLIEYVNKVGFLPLFKNQVDGFSVEEHADARYWWSGNAEKDPWEWRVWAARSKKVAYGKFFAKKAGFISLEWLPLFVNYRRDGYDFDSLYEEGLARARSKKIMDLFEDNEELFSFEIRRGAGFGKGGEKNFGGMVTELQMQTYLAARDFRYRVNKRGEEYGMSVAVYSTPEHMWGYDLVTSDYRRDPSESFADIMNRAKELYPYADEKDIAAMLKI